MFIRSFVFQKHEKKKQEHTLSEEFCSALDYIKQFVPDENGIQYVAFDMARVNRSYVNFERRKHFSIIPFFSFFSKHRRVMPKLDEIARRYLQQTGFFQNFPVLVHDRQYFYDR